MIISGIITLIIGLVGWYITLIPINPRSLEFWQGAIFLIIIYSGVLTLHNLIKKKELRSLELTFKSLAFTILVIVGIIGVGGFLSSPIIRAKSYSKMLDVKKGDFSKNITEIEPGQIPVIDRVTATNLGDRKMGEMVNLASQFNVSNAYTQIDYQDKPVRVTPLEYGDLFKWFNNMGEGIPGYITVDMTDGNTILHQLEDKIRYSKSDKFGRDIRRHIMKKYPTRIIYDISFEIDEEGAPYWIAPTYKKTIGLFGGVDVNSTVVTNAVTGETKEYKLDKIPTWIDRIYDADRIVTQMDDWGSLKSGYINSVIGQKNVLMTTEGYNYLALDDDVFLYTGMTSASRDSSNIGFMLSNLRTKETTLYEMPSADEHSAMRSAEGEIQEKEYNSTFPILLNIDGKATYMMALKDNAQLIRSYAFVDAQDYQKVSLGSTVEEALTKFGAGKITKEVELEETSKEITVNDIEAVVIDGNTYYYIKSGDDIYKVSIKMDERLPFIGRDEKYEVKYVVGEDGMKEIKSLKEIEEEKELNEDE